MSVKFPFQIYYDLDDGEGYRLLEQELTSESKKWRVVYNNSSAKVEYAGTAVIDGATYANVFYLKPGQTAAIRMPEDTVSYYIRECGVDTTIYNEVFVNGETVTGETPSGAVKTQFFETSPASVADRAKVTFSNQVDPSQLRTLTITKRLFDAAVAADGTITYSGIRRINDGDTMTLDGTAGGAVRTDTITNTRSGGLTIVKVNVENQPLSGAEFALKRGETTLGAFTSSADGLVTTLYLDDGTYTLSETKAPKGYQGLADDLTITASNGAFTIEGGGEEANYDASERTLTIKNLPFTLMAKKVDAKTNEPLAEAHFALYRQVKGSSGPIKNYYPLAGYEDVVSAADGVIPSITAALDAGSYYLTEIQAPEGYELASPVNEVLFTISETGRVTVKNGTGYIGSVVCTGTNSTDYTLLVPNGKPDTAALTITKKVTGGMGDRSETNQFVFTLTRVADELEGATYTWTKTSANGVETSGSIETGATFTLAHGDSIVINLPVNKEVVLSEEHGIYSASWQMEDEEATAGSQKTLTLTGDASLTVTNNLEAVSPTGVKLKDEPFEVMALAGLVLLAGTMIHRRRRKMVSGQSV